MVIVGIVTVMMIEKVSNFSGNCRNSRCGDNGEDE